jgi:hypothetical protein
VRCASGKFEPAAECGVEVVTGVTETFTAAAWAASPTVRAEAVRRTLIPIIGTEALICYQFDDGEHARRRRASAGAVSSADVLELLLDLPIAMPVPVASLTRRECAALRLAPRGAVSVCDGQVTRHAVAPVTVELALVAARAWRDGLAAAGRFTPFCARAMMLRRRPSDLAEVQLEAGFYGVGVIVVDDESTEVLVEPAPFQRFRFTAAGWRFLEDVYQLVR